MTERRKEEKKKNQKEEERTRQEQKQEEKKTSKGHKEIVLLMTIRCPAAEQDARAGLQIARLFVAGLDAF